jgi:hypothetical protein
MEGSVPKERVFESLPRVVVAVGRRDRHFDNRTASRSIEKERPTAVLGKDLTVVAANRGNMS